MPGLPEIKKEQGFDYHFVAVEEIGSMLGRGWQVHPDYKNQWPDNPSGLLMFPMMRKSVAPPKAEFWDMATAVKAVKNSVEGITKIDPEHQKVIWNHLDKLVPKDVKA